MRKEDLEAELKLLAQLERVTQVKGLDVLEQYAATQFKACENKTFVEDASDPSLHLANCQFYRGQGHVWYWIQNMRKSVEAKIALVRQELTAHRKEEE